MDKNKIFIKNITYEYLEMHSGFNALRGIEGVSVDFIYGNAKVHFHANTNKELTPNEIRDEIIKAVAEEFTQECYASKE